MTREWYPFRDTTDKMYNRIQEFQHVVPSKKK